MLKILSVQSGALFAPKPILTRLDHPDHPDHHNHPNHHNHQNHHNHHNHQNREKKNRFISNASQYSSTFQNLTQLLMRNSRNSFTEISFKYSAISFFCWKNLFSVWAAVQLDFKGENKFWTRILSVIKILTLIICFKQLYTLPTLAESLHWLTDSL